VVALATILRRTRTGHEEEVVVTVTLVTPVARRASMLAHHDAKVDAINARSMAIGPGSVRSIQRKRPKQLIMPMPKLIHNLLSLWLKFVIW
jgi:hypothetical protein